MESRACRDMAPPPMPVEEDREDEEVARREEGMELPPPLMSDQKLCLAWCCVREEEEVGWRDWLGVLGLCFGLGGLCEVLGLDEVLGFLLVDWWETVELML